MTLDPEISAMSGVLEILKTLDRDQRKRLIDWTSARFNLVGAEVPETAPAEEINPEPLPPAEAEAPEPEPVHPPIPKQRGRRKKSELQPETEAAAPSEEPPAPTPKEMKDFNSLPELFKASKVKTIKDKILLAAAYLYEKNNIVEFTSQNINTALKKIGPSIKNISLSITRILEKDPEVLEMTRKEGGSKQARRNFKLTEKGLETAKDYIAKN